MKKQLIEEIKVNGSWDMEAEYDEEEDLVRVFITDHGKEVELDFTLGKGEMGSFIELLQVIRDNAHMTRTWPNEEWKPFHPTP